MNVSTARDGSRTERKRSIQNWDARRRAEKYQTTKFDADAILADLTAMCKRG